MFPIGFENFISLLYYFGLVVITNVANFICRSKTIPRTIWMTCTQIVMIITYLLFASAIDGTLYAATALLGICYGVQFSIMIPTVSELFGRTDAKIRKIMVAGIVRDFENAARENAKRELNGVQKVVLGGLMG